ncbi:hypothetical protein SAMN05192561_12711 [Halopenitus malekzadehii]|uniref:Uncharacterized protein n=1 Tax=Halopenitus malekzadehii TaxID=1267564 RepID=A0A1H6K6F8_9EURY|nr:hypothetical protein [Halopenitus malekzadehii]SEH67070.1 hypothetical protein SAMN05192561_12711 [Halopenitus malekzadehii]
MRRILTVTILILGALATVWVAPVQAQDSPELTCGSEQVDANVDRSVALFNDNTDAIPSSVATIVSSNTTEIRISNASQQSYTVSLNESLTITDVNVGPAADPDVTVTMNRTTACTVSTADDPVSVAQQMYRDDAITVQGNGLVNQAKTGIIDIAVEVGRFF